MNKYQKELLQDSLKSEKKVLSDLRKTYEQAEKDIDKRIEALLSRFNATDDANLQRTIIYQMDYQRALKKQIGGILDDLNGRQFETISDYIQKSYEDGFIGTLYDLQGQGVPLIFPIDQEQVTTAIAKNSKLSKSLYSALGEDVEDLKKRVQNELSRGIAQNHSYAQIAKNIRNQTTIGYNRAARIARTEGHRVQQAAQADAQLKAKEAGADVVKQWDATLDGRTRNAHRTLDGQVRELDEPFEINGNKAQYPGDFGIPSQDIHCRCVTLTRARWAVDDETDATKFDNETGQIVEIESKSYQDFKKKYWKTLDKTTGQSNNDVEFDPSRYSALSDSEYEKFARDATHNQGAVLRQRPSGEYELSDMSQMSPEAQTLYGQYVGTNHSWDINAYCRNPKTSSFSAAYKLKMDSEIAAIDKLISSAEMPKDCILTRFVDDDYLKAIFGDTDIGVIKQNVNQVITEKQFLSTSSNINKNLFKNRDAKLTMYVAEGTKCFPTLNFEESEIILPRGTKYVLQDVKTDSSGKIELIVEILEDK